MPSIARTINYSFSTANFPYRWKTAKVNPLFKKGDVSGPSNYRPNFVVTVLLVSILWRLLNVTFTILCMTFFNWTTWFILDSPVFVQHGNQTALIKQVDELILILDNNRVSGVLLVDYCNAFDLVDHNLFWLKLEEDACIPSQNPSQDSTLDSTIFRFPAIFTSFKSYDGWPLRGGFLWQSWRERSS